MHQDYGSIEDALYDDQSIISIAIDDKSLIYGTIVCAVIRDGKTEIIETAHVSFGYIV